MLPLCSSHQLYPSSLFITSTASFLSVHHINCIFTPLFITSTAFFALCSSHQLPSLLSVHPIARILPLFITSSALSILLITLPASFQSSSTTSHASFHLSSTHQLHPSYLFITSIASFLTVHHIARILPLCSSHQLHPSSLFITLPRMLPLCSSHQLHPSSVHHLAASFLSVISSTVSFLSVHHINCIFFLSIHDINCTLPL